MAETRWGAGVAGEESGGRIAEIAQVPCQTTGAATQRLLQLSVALAGGDHALPGRNVPTPRERRGNLSP